jgi:hypothetical protein
MIRDMKTTYPAGKEAMIMVCDGLIDPTICKDFISGLASLWPGISYPGQTMGGLNPQTKSSEDAAFSQLGFTEKGVAFTEPFALIEQAFVDALFGAIALYKNEFRALWDWSNIEDTGFQVQKYRKYHGFYREHVDSFPGTNSGSRVASGIIYLNTVEHGGETAFPLHKASVEAVQGRIVLFPSLWTHPHEGRTPLSDDKWIINTFFLNKQESAPQPEQPEHIHDHFDPEDIFEWSEEENHGHEDHQH